MPSRTAAIQAVLACAESQGKFQSACVRSKLTPYDCNVQQLRRVWQHWHWDIFQMLMRQSHRIQVHEQFMTDFQYTVWHVIIQVWYDTQIMYKAWYDTVSTVQISLHTNWQLPSPGC